MIIGSFQILCSSGWKDIHSYNIETDKVATINPLCRSLEYEYARSMFFMRCPFRIKSIYNQYACVQLSEGSRLFSSAYGLKNRSGSIAEEFSEQWFEEITETQATLSLQKFLAWEDRKASGKLDLFVVDKVMALAACAGFCSSIKYSESVLDKPNIHIGYEEGYSQVDHGFLSNKPFGCSISTSSGVVIIRTFCNSQWTSFVVLNI